MVKTHVKKVQGGLSQEMTVEDKGPEKRGEFRPCTGEAAGDTWRGNTEEPGVWESVRPSDPGEGHNMGQEF